MLKRLRRRLATLGPAVFHKLSDTWRLRIQGAMPPEKAVIAFWHGEMLPAWKCFADQGATALVSHSRDGGLLTELLENWGFTVARGSSSKGGDEALAEIVAAAQRGRVLITPDGPRGPARKMKPGAVVAAQRAGVPLYLCRVKAAKAVRGTNWDRFVIPLPFSTIDLEFVALDIPLEAGREAIDGLIVKAEQLLNPKATK